MSRLRALVNDVGVSQTTLEEVFMIVTGKKVSKRKEEWHQNTQGQVPVPEERKFLSEELLRKEETKSSPHR